MKKRIMSLILVIMLMSITACGQKTEQKEVKQEEAVSKITKAVEQAAKELENVTYPITITDQMGREVVIDKEPETIVSGYYIATSYLISLGMADKMVGVEAKADKRKLYSIAAPNLTTMESVGSLKNFNLEGCAALKPDLIIMSVRLKESIDTLEELGFNVIAVDPETEELKNEAMRLIARATNKVAKGEELIMKSTELVEEALKAIENVEPVSVYVAGNKSFLSTCGKAMYQDSLVTKGGAINVASELEDSYWAEVSYEQVLAWNPSVIILTPNASYKIEDVLNDSALKELDAVKNNRVYKMPSPVEAWDSPIYTSPLGILWTAKTLHPDEYSKETYEEAAKGIYKEVYNVELTNEEI